jgi:hypothetical protein
VVANLAVYYALSAGECVGINSVYETVTGEAHARECVDSFNCDAFGTVDFTPPSGMPVRHTGGSASLENTPVEPEVIIARV